MVLRLSPIIDKLQLNRIILFLESRYHGLQIIAALADHANGIALNLRAHFGMLVPNQLGNLAPQVLGNPLLKLERLPYLAASSLLNLPRLQNLQRKTASNQFAFQHIADTFQRELAVRRNSDAFLRLIANIGFRIFQIKACRYFAPRLIERIDQFLLIKLGHDIKRTLSGHILPSALKRHRAKDRHIQRQSSPYCILLPNALTNPGRPIERHAALVFFARPGVQWPWHLRLAARSAP